MINIIMPAYNAHGTIRQAVASVAMQDGVEDVLLTIVDDCSDEPYDYIVNDFRYIKIEVLRKSTNTGPGQARQYAIDKCNREYFMFLDSDDCLYSPIAVQTLYSCMEYEELDSLYTTILEELSDGSFLMHQNNGVWLHGKMFRTKYIQGNNIRFGETWLHEDHAFNTISLWSGGRNLFVDCITYLWKYHAESLTRSEAYKSNFLYSTSEFVAAAEYTMSELMKRNVEAEKIYEIVKKYILSFYRYYNEMLNNGLPDSQINKFLEYIKRFCGGIPREVSRNLSKGFLVENFYEDNSIKGMINSNILFNISFTQYCQLLSIKN